MLGRLVAFAVFTVVIGIAQSASAHVTPFDPGVPPGQMVSGQATLPDGQQVQIVDQAGCEAARQEGESCDGSGLYIVTASELAAGTQLSYSIVTTDGATRTGTATISTGGLLVGALSGASAAPSGGSLFAQRGGIESIVVQTQKKAESVQTVPVPVTAFSALAIERKFAINLEDLNKLAPSVQLQHVGLFHSASSFTIRGIGTSGIESFDDPHVAIFIDGVYQARNAWAIANLLDVEQVEMLRGPQGTIYGRNAYSGAIVLRTNRPDMTDFGGKLSLRLANAGNVVVDVVGNMPVVPDKFAMRIASQYFKHDGYYKNDGIVDLATGEIDPDLEGKRIQGNKYVYLRPSFRLTPNDRLDITLTTEFIRQRGDGTVSLNPVYDPRTPSNPLCGGAGTSVAYNCDTSLFEVLFPGFNQNYFGDASRGIAADPNADPYRVNYNLPAGNDNDLNSYLATLNADYSTDFGTFSFLANYMWQRSAINTDTDGTYEEYFASTRFEDYETYQFEFHFVSDFSERLEMIAGLFYLWDSYHVAQILWTPGQAPFTLQNSQKAYYQNGQDRKTWAAYVQFEYHLTDALSAVAGVRYSWEKKFDVFGIPNTSQASQGIPLDANLRRFPMGVPCIDPAVAAGTGPNQAQCSRLFGPVEDTWDNFAPRVGLNYQANDDVLLFAFWQRAFKSGGFVTNAAELGTFLQPYGEERIDNFEIGVKSEWLDRRLQINANVYYQKHNGLQRQIIRPANNPSGQETFITNAANARAYGFEVEVVYVPVDGLTINANLAYNNIKYTGYCAELDGPEATPSPSNGRAVCGDVAQLPNGQWVVETDFSDLPLAFAPDIIANFGWTYDFPVGNMGNMSIGSSLSYTDNMFVSSSPTFPGTDRRSMWIVDAQVSWEHPDGRYRVSVWGKNLTNEIERLSVTPVAFLFSFEQGTRPRTYGITMTAEF